MRKRYVTDNGRSLPTGTVTRNSLSVKRQKVKPLPFELQCHPQPLRRKPRHPQCLTEVSHVGHQMRIAKQNTMRTQSRYSTGHGLSTEPSTCEVVVHGHGTWYHHDMHYALGWRNAARAAGFRVDVYLK